MDIGKLVQPEHLHKLELTLDGEPIGVEFDIRSTNSKEAKAVQSRNLKKAMERNRKGKGATLSLEELTESVVEQYAATVAGWNWNGHEYSDLGADPEFSIDNVKRVISEQDWIFDQVKEAADEIENFIVKPKAPAKSTSSVK
jgi:hypothetical protein